MLLVLKACIQSIHDTLVKDVSASYQMTTDDLLDQLLYVVLQASGVTDYTTSLSVHPETLILTSPFPIATILYYIDTYHMQNVHTTTLGYALANFQVAVEWYLLRSNQRARQRFESDGTFQESLKERSLKKSSSLTHISSCVERSNESNAASAVRHSALFQDQDRVETGKVDKMNQSSTLLSPVIELVGHHKISMFPSFGKWPLREDSYVHIECGRRYFAALSGKTILTY